MKYPTNFYTMIEITLIENILQLIKHFKQLITFYEWQCRQKKTKHYVFINNLKKNIPSISFQMSTHFWFNLTKTEW